jgi:hypothetical protein
VAPTRPAEPTRYPTLDPHLRPLSPDVAPLTREEWERLNGIEIAHKTIGGELVPYPAPSLFGMRVETAEPGHVVYVMPASEWFCARARTVAAGVLASAAHLRSSPPS